MSKAGRPRNWLLLGALLPFVVLGLASAAGVLVGKIEFWLRGLQ
jgi:hypothetical protein